MTMTISGITPTTSGGTVEEGTPIGIARIDDIRIVMNNIDKSNVDDIENIYVSYICWNRPNTYL